MLTRSNQHTLLGVFCAVWMCGFCLGTAAAQGELPEVLSIELPYDEGVGEVVAIDFIKIPLESYEMGAVDPSWSADTAEFPVHTVHLPTDAVLYVAKTELTQAQWLSMMSVTDNPGWAGNDPALQPNESYGLGNNYPVNFLTYPDCLMFLEALNAYAVESGQAELGFKVPSEAEWEYFARGGTTTMFSFGTSTNHPLLCDPGELDGFAWFCGNNGELVGDSDYGTKEVAQKQPNPFGLYDIHGNVWEWTEDNYHNSYVGAPTDGSAWADGAYGMVIRGGDFASNPFNCRSSRRLRSVANDRFNGLGLRPVRLDYFAPVMGLTSETLTVYETLDTYECTVTVEMSEARDRVITVDYETFETGSAIGNLDFIPMSGTLTFTTGTILQELTLQIPHDDELNEPDETFGLRLTAASKAKLGSQREMLITIHEITRQSIIDRLLGVDMSIPDDALDENKDGSVDAADLIQFDERFPPLEPTRPSPWNGATDLITAVSLQWAKAGRADSYNLYLWPSTEAVPESPTASGLTATQWGPVVLDYGTTYQWYVEAVNAQGATSSETWSFTIMPQPPDVEVIDPDGGEVFYVDGSLWVHWRLGPFSGTTARIELWRDSSRVAVLGTFTDADQEGLSQVALPAVPEANDYYLRVYSTLLEKEGAPVPYAESNGNFSILPAL